MANSNQVNLKGKEVATLIQNDLEESQEVLIKTTYETVWIGGEDTLTVDDGFMIGKFETLRVKLSPNDVLYSLSLRDTKIYTLTT